jgi:transcriptional regulator with XRE-family HTH domain
MTARNSKIDRDEVLFAFHRECERPTALQIIEWTERYPQFADDIRAHAAVRLDRAPGHDETDLEPDQTMLARGRSRALNAVYHARQEADAGQAAASPVTWQQMLGAKGFTVPQLARHINIDRMVLAELAAGRMRPPIGIRLVDALTDALDVSPSSLDTAVAQLVAAPRLGHAKADRAPTIYTRSYEEIIRASNMSDQLKWHWLGED